MRQLACGMVVFGVLLLGGSCQRPGDAARVERRQAEIDFRTGDVSGSILWNGEPLNARETIYLFEPGSVSQSVDGSNGSSYQLQNLAAGVHALGLYAHSCTEWADSKLGDTTFTVRPAELTTANVDLGATNGRVKGSISVNGTPLPNTEILLRMSGDTQGHCGNRAVTDDNGFFSRILNPQTYTAEVRSAAGFIGSFDFSVLAGQTTDVDTLTTPPGDNQTVHLMGGVAAPGGIQLVFTHVDIGGHTTVVQSGTGPRPADGYKIVGFQGTERYWDITTTAAIRGLINVCIHYYPSEVTGNEQLLELHHDGGSGFSRVMDMTLDTSANVVCGNTDSLSPFVVVEPIVAPNTAPVVTVPGNVLLEATGPRGAVATFSAAAFDAEDGPRLATCAPTSGSTFAIGTTTVVCTATDSRNLAGHASFTVTVADTTGPAFAPIPGTVVAFASGTNGAKVTYQKPTAVDAVDGTSKVNWTPAPGSLFPVGKTPITCAASDLHGNTSRATFTLWVQYQAPTDGTFFLKPIRSDGSSIFRIGRAVPVKFKLTGASANITNLQAKLVVTKISDAVLGTAEDMGDEDGEDTDLTFRYRPGKQIYGYRWKTRGQTQGTYRLKANLGDDVLHEINVSLKGGAK